jgi:hypothetical protein
MALKALNSVAGFSVGEVANVVIYANSDVSPANLVVSGKSNLNSISNVVITGGSSGYIVSTDGTGNLSFIAPPSSTGITNGTSNVNIPTVNGNITFTVNGTSNVGLFTQTSLDMQANINPAQANTYQLGNATNRWNNVYSNTANFAGNISAGGLLTDNLYYANGNPWDLQEAAGSNTQIQYNDGLNNFGASANFTYNDSTRVFTVLGNSQFNNANLGNLAIANFVNVASNVTTSNLTVNLELAGNTANFSGNIKALNSNLGNLATANFANIASNTITSNLSVNLELQGNTANFDGNVIMDSWLTVANTANVGNLRTDNLLYANGTPWDLQQAAGSNYEIQFNIDDNFTASSNLTYNDSTRQFVVLGNAQFNNANLGNLATSNFANISSNIITSNLTVNLELAGNTANFSGNIKTLNADLGNLAVANFIRTGEILNGNSNISILANGNINFSATGLANVMTISNVGANVIGYVSANGNGTFGAVYSNTVNATSGNLTLSSFQTGDTSIQLRTNGNGTVDVGNVRITSLAEPNAASDAATKQYVDDVAQGLNIHDACQAATPNTLAIVTGGTITYNNGTAGVGANLTTTGSFNLIDGVNVQTAGTRILVKNEANSVHNGIYTWSNATVITRATDFNSVPEVEAGDFTFITAGTLYDNTGWVQTSSPASIGGASDFIEFTQFSGAGTYQAGAGLTLTGAVFSVNVDNITTAITGGNVVVKASAVLTTPNIGAATGTSLDLTGNVLAGNVNSNSKITAANIEVTSNVIADRFFANANVTTLQFISNVSTGTAPLQVTSTTRVANLNVSYANVSDFGVITTQSTGTYYPTFVNSSSTGNLALASNSAISANLANGSLIATTFAGNLSGTNANVTTANIAGNVILGNSSITTAITWGSATTTSISANQTVASISTTGVTGIEFLVKGIDSAGAGKYSVATVQAVTDGTNVDYSVFGTVNLGGSTGSLAVNISGGFVRLQVTPASSNSTVWTTQFRII